MRNGEVFFTKAMKNFEHKLINIISNFHEEFIITTLGLLHVIGDGFNTFGPLRVMI